MKHKLKSRLLGEISITSDMQMTPPFWQKAKKTKEHVDEIETLLKACSWKTLSFCHLYIKGRLCMLSCFSHVQLFVTPWTVTHQAPLSMKFFLARIPEWVAISFSRRSS